MSVQSEIDRIKKNVNDTLKAIGDTGVQVGAGSDALPAASRALANEKQNKLTGTAGQFVGFDAEGNAQAQDVSASGIPTSEKGQPNGVATLDQAGKVPEAQIPERLSRQNLLSAETAAMLGLDETAVPDDAFRMVPGVGDIVTGARAGFLTGLEDRFLPCMGQILSAEKYPAYAKLQGPITGYSWTQLETVNLPYDFNCMIQLKSGRLLAIGYASSSENNTKRTVYMSDDLGKNWSQTNATEKNGTASIIQKMNGTVLAFIGQNVFTSVDNGNSWAKSTASLNVVPFGAHQVIEPLDGRLIAVVGSYVVASTDGGSTWRSVLGLGAGQGQVAAGKDGVIYAVSSFLPYGSPEGVNSLYVSSDGGETWTHCEPSSSKDGYLCGVAVIGAIGIAFGGHIGYFFGSRRASWTGTLSDNYQTTANRPTCVTNGHVIHNGGKIMVNFDANWINPVGLPQHWQANGVKYTLLQDGRCLAFQSGGTQISLYVSAPDSSVIVLPDLPGYLIRVK